MTNSILDFACGTVETDFLNKCDRSVSLSKSSVFPTTTGVLELVPQPDVTLISTPPTNEKTPMPDPHDEHFMLDCDTLTKMQLRRKYKAEANAHRNMLRRAKEGGRTIAPEFQEFRSYLKRVGRRPARKATVDRIYNNDPEYETGKVRWADKDTQNNNKSDTRLIHCSKSNETYTVSRLARIKRVKPATIRKRLSRGWTHDEIISGKRNRVLVEDVKKSDARLGSDLSSLIGVWEAFVCRTRGSACSKLTDKEIGLLKAFSKFCDSVQEGARTAEILVTVLSNWSTYREALIRDYGIHNPPTFPNFAVLAQFPRPAIDLWNTERLSLFEKARDPVSKASETRRTPEIQILSWDETGIPDAEGFAAIQSMGVHLGRTHEEFVVRRWTVPWNRKLVIDMPGWARHILERGDPQFSQYEERLRKALQSDGAAEVQPSARDLL